MKCVTGNFTMCDDKTTGAKGTVVINSDDEESDSDDDENSSDESDESDEEDTVLSDMEEEEIFRHTDYTGMIEKGSFIAIYSSETSEGFYICQVMDIKHSMENINDGQHFLPADTDYMECMYLEKGRENFKKGTVQYSFTKQFGIVYVTFDQVFYPMVIVSPDRTISLTDYLCISEAALRITGR